MENNYLKRQGILNSHNYTNEFFLFRLLRKKTDRSISGHPKNEHTIFQRSSRSTIRWHDLGVPPHKISRRKRYVKKNVFPCFVLKTPKMQ